MRRRREWRMRLAQVEETRWSPGTRSPRHAVRGMPAASPPSAPRRLIQATDMFLLLSHFAKSNSQHGMVVFDTCHLPSALRQNVLEPSKRTFRPVQQRHHLDLERKWNGHDGNRSSYTYYYVTHIRCLSHESHVG